MTLSAFHGHASLRLSTMARLTDSLAAGRLAPGPLAWGPAGGSVVGCMLESDDLDQWQATLGLPKWLAVSTEALSAQQETDAGACDMGTQIIAAIRPGANLGPTGSALLQQVLALILKTPGMPLSPALQAALRTVHDLHQRSAAGETVPAAEWRAARKAASALVDSLSGTNEKVWATCVETAGWDPQTSSSVVFDSMRVWRDAVIDGALIAHGWDDAADLAMGELFRSLYEAHVEGKPEPRSTVFELLETMHPEQAERLHAKIRVENAAAKANIDLAAQLLLTTLRAA